MMLFRTELNIGKSTFNIAYQHKVMLIGSCFSDHIGHKLESVKMNVYSNPFGVAFNPFSIVQSISRAIANELYDKVERNNDLYFSFDHHSSFSSTSKDLILESINSAIFKLNAYLKDADVLFVTLGSAWVYRHIVQNRIVANCHKIPNKEFVKELLSLESIVQSFSHLLEQLKDFNPKLKIVFTVSPVRHLKDGFIENQRSKAILLESVHRIVEANDNCSYFPSYEIVMDDLRDYRFFKKDMLHLNEIGVDYVWKKFCDFYFDNQTQIIVNEVGDLNAFLQHKSITDVAGDLKKESALAKMKEKYPFLKWQ